MSNKIPNSNTTPGTLPVDDNAIVRAPTVLAMVPVCLETLRLWEIAGKFPARIKLGKKAMGWRAGAIRQWLATRTTGVAA